MIKEIVLKNKVTKLVIPNYQENKRGQDDISDDRQLQFVVNLNTQLSYSFCIVSVKLI